MTTYRQPSFSNNKQSALKFINKIPTLELDSQSYSTELKENLNRLKATETLPELNAIVDELMEEKLKIADFLSKEFDKLDTNEEAVQRIKSHLEADEEHRDLLNLLNFNQVIKTTIQTNKERLSEQKLFDSLPAAQQKVAHKFIERIKTLKLIKDCIEEERSEFQIRLRNARSISEVNRIGEEINIINRGFSGILKELISFPSDEYMAGPMVEFMETNPHLFDIMKSFDIKKALAKELEQAINKYI